MSEQTAAARSWPVALLAMVPFLAGWCFHSRPEAAPVKGDRATASLVFDQYLVDYGPSPIMPRPIVEVPFYCRNVSDREIKITNLMPSCGCLQPKIDHETIPPGGVARLVMPVVTANEQPGPQEYVVKVSYLDDSVREVDLGLKLVLPEKQVEVTPRAMWFYQSGDKPTTQYVTIRDHRLRSFNVRSIDCSSDLWTVEKRSDLRDEHGQRLLRIAVTLNPGAPTGKHRAVIDVLTDDPAHARIQIPIGCQRTDGAGPATGMEFQAGTLRLKPTPTGGLTAIANLVNRDGTPATVANIDNSSPDVVQATVETNAKNQTILRVSAEQPTETDHRAVISVRTEQSENVMTIPVIVPGK